MLVADRFCESRMREILTSGSMRGEEVGPWPRFLSYSTRWRMEERRALAPEGVGNKGPTGTKARSLGSFGGTTEVVP
jgi:hypothetical protein